MGDSGFQELDPMAAMQALGLLAASLGIIGVVSVRLWAGPDMQDYPGRKPQQILADRRVRLTSGLVLIAAWATVVIGLVRHALRPGVGSLLASHLGPVPIPQWLALVIQNFFWSGLLCVMIATLKWLERKPPPSLQVRS